MAMGWLTWLPRMRMTMEEYLESGRVMATDISGATTHHSNGLAKVGQPNPLTHMKSWWWVHGYRGPLPTTLFFTTSPVTAWRTLSSMTWQAARCVCGSTKTD